MPSWNGWDTNPIRYQPLPGKEVKDDGTVLGVPEWREDNILKLVDIKDEVNDEASATRSTIESVGEEIEANNTAEHTSTRATITTKSDEEQVKLDDIDASINAEAALTRKIISSVHSNVHAGLAYMTRANNSNLGNGSTLNIKVTTGLTSPHMVFDVHGKLDFEFKCYEAPTSSGGTALNIYNKNRTSSNTSTLTAVEDTGSIVGGTIILHDLISEGHKQGGNVEFDREIILKASTDYIFEIESLAASNLVHINLEWYEPS